MSRHTAYLVERLIPRGWHRNVISLLVQRIIRSRNTLTGQTADTILVVIHNIVWIQEVYSEEERLSLLVQLLTLALQPVN